MSAPKWTAGPWKAVSAATCAEIEVMEIAEVSHMRVIPVGGGWPTAGAPEDDARLIAAAPELYAALEAVLAAHKEQPPSTVYQAEAELDRIRKAVAKARAALAKARGEA